MRKLWSSAILSFVASFANADEGFVASCKEAMTGSPGGGGMICSCFSEGLSAGADADELLAIAGAPREGRREIVQSSSADTRKVMRGCMQKMRGGAGGRQGGPRQGGPRQDNSQ